MKTRGTLYHGTPQFYFGPPTRGSKDVLGTKFLSMTTNPHTAEFFAGSNRDSRVFSMEVPREAVLDLRRESEDLSKRGQQRLAALMQKAAKSGQYEAVAINDITGGTDEMEFG